MYKIIIVEDHPMFRQSIGLLLEKEEIAKVIANAANGKEFLDIIDKYEPDVVLMDIAMPVMDGIEASRLALEKKPDLKILTLSSFGDEHYYFKMVEAGVKGFILKDSSLAELEQAIGTIAEGGNWFSGELIKKVITSINKSQKNNSLLTEREIEVLQLICQGQTNEQIGESLGISYDTVRWHRSNLLSKTACVNTAALVMYAIKNKLIEI